MSDDDDVTRCPLDHDVLRREIQDKGIAFARCPDCDADLVSCLVYRPDHNGECLLCDEWLDAHTPEAIAEGERLAEALDEARRRANEEEEQEEEERER